MRNVPEKKYVEKITTHILSSITFSEKSCCLGDNVGGKKYIVDPARTQMAV
jgi:hypothetical protein